MNNLIVKMSIVALLATTATTTLTTAASAQLTNPPINVFNNPNSPPPVKPALDNQLYIKPFETVVMNGQIQLIEAHTLEPNTPVVLTLTYPTGSTALFATVTDVNGYVGIVFPVDSFIPGNAWIEGIIESENQISATPIASTFMVLP